jgi:hypothetical protein
LVTYFEDPWVCERERRTSVEKEIRIEESEMYKSMRPTDNPPLLYGMLKSSADNLFLFFSRMRRAFVTFVNTVFVFPGEIITG